MLPSSQDCKRSLEHSGELEPELGHRSPRFPLAWDTSFAHGPILLRFLLKLKAHIFSPRQSIDFFFKNLFLFVSILNNNLSLHVTVSHLFSWHIVDGWLYLVFFFFSRGGTARSQAFVPSKLPIQRDAARWGHCHVRRLL